MKNIFPKIISGENDENINLPPGIFIGNRHKNSIVKFTKKEINMPCHDPLMGMESWEIQNKLFHLQRKLNQLTDMLCRTMKHRDEFVETLPEYYPELDQDVRDWWQEHKKLDAERNK